MLKVLVCYYKPGSLVKTLLAFWYIVLYQHAQHQQNHIVCIYPPPPMLPRQFFKWPHNTVWLLLSRWINTDWNKQQTNTNKQKALSFLLETCLDVLRCQELSESKRGKRGRTSLWTALRLMRGKTRRVQEVLFVMRCSSPFHLSWNDAQLLVHLCCQMNQSLTMWITCWWWVLMSWSHEKKKKKALQFLCNQLLGY